MFQLRRFQGARKLARNDGPARLGLESLESRQMLSVNPVSDLAQGSAAALVAPPVVHGVGGTSSSSQVQANGVSGFQITLDMTGLTSSQITITQQAAARWQSVLVGDLPDATYEGTPVDDVLMDVVSEPIDGPGGILGQSGPDAFRSGSMLPYHGGITLDTADMAQLEADGQLGDVLTHEMGHILGLGTIWSQKGLLRGQGGSGTRLALRDPAFTGPLATAEYNSLFGTNAKGVPVEEHGGPGTAKAHWRETVFDNELMTGYLNSGTNNPLSRITVASMADLGYQVNMANAEPYTKPVALRAASRLIDIGGDAGTRPVSTARTLSTPRAADLALTSYLNDVDLRHLSSKARMG
jgi:hypothetical protein